MIQNYVIQFVSDLRQVCRFLQVLQFFPLQIKLTATYLTEILLKMALNTITLTLTLQKYIYICTIYTRLYTCLTSFPRFALREKLTLRLLKLLFKGVDVVEWSRALDVRLSEWCCSVSMVWVHIPSREEQKFDSSKI